MTEIATNVALTSVLLSVVLWVSKTNAILGGFIVSLPISTLIVLAFSRIQQGETGNTQLLAKSIFVALPATLTFFIPFLLADRLKLSFWTSYFTGICLLTVSFFIHKWLVTRFLINPDV